MRQIAIVTPIPPMYSETFIHKHLKRLPYSIHHFHSLPKMGFHPIMDGAGQCLTINFKPVFYLETLVDVLTGHKGVGYNIRRGNMKKYFLKHNIEAVLAEYGPTGAHVAEACRQTNTPLIVHYHGRDAYHYKTLDRYKDRYRKMFDIAAAIVVVSNDMRAQLVALGCPEEKLMLNPYGPDDSLFKPIEQLERDPVYLSVGRFTAKKSPDKVLNAFARTAKEVPEAKLIMAGDGELFEQSKAHAEALGLGQKVVFTGPVNPTVISGLHRTARIFIQHSVRAADGDSEGTPVAILEAMGSGLPIISTRHAGIKDAVVEGETGYLVDENDVDGMVDYMIELGKDYERCAAMGASGAQRIRSRYTLERHLGELTRIIDQAIADN